MPLPDAFDDLPRHSKLDALRDLNISDKLAYSLTSTEAKTLVTELNTNIGFLTWQFDDEDTHHIELGDFQLDIKHDPDIPIGEADVFGTVTLNGNPYTIARGDSWRWELVDPGRTREHYLDIVHQFSKHILDVFHVEEFILKTWDTLDILDFFVWKFTKKFEEVTAYADAVHDEELKFLFEELEVERFELEGKDDLKYTGVLKMAYLNTEFADWFTLETALNMQCREVIIRHDVFPAAHWNVLIKAWISGDYLHNLELFRATKDDDRVFDNVFDGIETFPWPHPEQRLVWREKEVSDGVGIRRADGTWATVLITSYYIGIHVWHPQYLEEL